MEKARSVAPKVQKNSRMWLFGIVFTDREHPGGSDPYKLCCCRRIPVTSLEAFKSPKIKTTVRYPRGYWSKEKHDAFGHAGSANRCKWAVLQRRRIHSHYNRFIYYIIILGSTFTG